MSGASRQADNADFNPHSPCGERRSDSAHLPRSAAISIHTPHAGSDKMQAAIDAYFEISIHTPHAGSDFDVHFFVHRCTSSFQSTLPMRGATPNACMRRGSWLRFQSTLPMRGATSFWVISNNDSINFNPHSPCGERRSVPMARTMVDHISIHTPHAGSDHLRIVLH